MDACTRPLPSRRQMRALTAAPLAAILLATPALISTTIATPLSETPTATAVAVLPVPLHRMTLRAALPGEPTLALDARLTSKSAKPLAGTGWTVRDKDGNLVLRSNESAPAAKLAPGSYVAEVKIGGLTARQKIIIPPGRSVMASLILNAGALRVLSLIKDVPGEPLPPLVNVYALSGKAQGRLVATTRTSAEMIYLAAGPYRVETRHGEGNSINVTDITIKPGIMSAMEVNHVAGLAHLSYVGAAQGDVAWTLKPDQGPALAAFAGREQTLALKPGLYTAEAVISGRKLVASFLVKAGEAQDIRLGE